MENSSCRKEVEQIYDEVVTSVTNNIRNVFQEEDVDQEVLDNLRTMWKWKLRKYLSPATSVGATQEPRQQLPGRKSPTQTTTMVKNTVPAKASGTVYLLRVIQVPQQLSRDPPALLPLSQQEAESAPELHQRPGERVQPKSSTSDFSEKRKSDEVNLYRLKKKKMNLELPEI